MSRMTKKRRKRQLRRRIAITLVLFGVILYNMIALNLREDETEKKQEGFDITYEATAQDDKANNKITEKTNNAVVTTELTDNNSTDKADKDIENVKVDKNYFSDAVFIGDSRTEGFVINTGVCDGYAIASKGLNVKSVFDKQCIKDENTYVTAIDAIRTKSYNKAYLMFGINETGWEYSDIFIDYYKKIIEEIKTDNPNAKIYVQSILPVSKSVSDSSSYINRSRINEYNNLIKSMSEDENVYYLDVYNSIADKDGYLPDDASSDGIHLNREYCLKWLDYLCMHTNG